MKLITIGLILVAWAATVIGNVYGIIHCPYPIVQSIYALVIIVFTLIAVASISVVARSKSL